MSADENRQEAKSSVKISTTAAGKPLVEVKIYDGCNQDEFEALRYAVKTYQQTTADLGATS